MSDLESATGTHPNESKVNEDKSIGGTEGVEEPPKHNSFVAFLQVTFGSVMAFIVYVPFLVSLLVQTIADRKPVNAAKWEEQISPLSWRIGWSLFLFMVAMAFIIPYAELPWIPEEAHTYIILVYILHLLYVHVGTIYYVSLRKDLEVDAYAEKIKKQRTASRLSLDSADDSDSNDSDSMDNHKIDAKNWRNYLAFVSIFIELIQLCSFAFVNTNMMEAKQVVTTGEAAEHVGWPQWALWLRDATLAVRFVFSSQYLTYYLCTAAVSLYVLLVGLFIVKKWQTDHYLGPVMFQILPGFAFISIVTNLSQAATFSQNQGIIAWSLLSLTFYATTAGFVSSYLDNAMTLKADLIFSPQFVVKERFMKGLLSIIAGVFQNQEASAGTAVVTALFLSYFIAKMQPCTGQIGNKLRFITLNIAVFVLVLSYSSRSGLLQLSWMEATLASVLGVLILVLVELSLFQIFDCFASRRRHRKVRYNAASTTAVVIKNPSFRNPTLFVNSSEVEAN